MRVRFHFGGLVAAHQFEPEGSNADGLDDYRVPLRACSSYLGLGAGFVRRVIVCTWGASEPTGSGDTSRAAPLAFVLTEKSV